MPHLTLEYSDNVIEQNNLENLFQQMHELLAEALPTQLSSCKSRAVGHKTYAVGDGRPTNAFVHVDLKIMPGRTQEVLQNTGKSILKILSNHFAQSIQKLNLQITLEISDVQEAYFKITSE